MTPTNEVFLEVGVRFSATTLGEPPPGGFCWVRTVQVRIDLPSRRGELSMRLSRPLALALALIVSPRSAPAQDIAGTVRSYDQAGRTLTLKPDGSKKEIRLLVPQGVSVRGNHAGAPPLPGIAPGTRRRREPRARNRRFYGRVEGRSWGMLD
jgi:hypothetical protein